MAEEKILFQEVFPYSLVWPDRGQRMRRTEKTLLEQMQICDIEIMRRMQLLDLNRETLNQLAGHKLVIEENIDAIVDEFYQKQIAIDDISLLINDAATLLLLRRALRKYVLKLFSGCYDSEYVNNRLRIGMVHKRIGLEPKLYLSSVKILKELVIKVLENNIENNEVLQKALDALDKLLYFEITLMFDTYINSLAGELETEKRKTEHYAKCLEDKVAERTKQLEEQTKLDPLTNIYNRRAMQDVLKRELATAKRRQTKLSIIYFDVDHFKDVNDTYGHIKGDEVLKYIGYILFNSVREVDVPCRFGGDEFCIILPECNIKNAKTICEKILNKFADRYPEFSLSVGIAETGTENYIDGDVLIKNADDMMYRAKREKGFQICA